MTNQESLKKRTKTGEISQEELVKIQSGAKRATLLANILDTAMLDPIAGLFEGAGDVATALAGLYIIYEAKKAGMSYPKLAKMLGRQALDLTAGSVPILGDMFDFIYRSNAANAKELRAHFKNIEKKKTEHELAEMKSQNTNTENKAENNNQNLTS